MADVRFVAEIAAIRDRARQKTGQGLVTDDPATRMILEYRLTERRLLTRMPDSKDERAGDILHLLDA
jgi:hypothetical protein